MTKPTTTAKTLVAKRLDAVKMDPKIRSSVLKGVDALFTELPRRDCWYDVKSVLLPGTRNVVGSAVSKLLAVETCAAGLVATTITPSWGRGWANVFEPGESYEMLSWLMHFVRQYVHRSLLLRVILPIADQHDLVSHVSTSLGLERSFGPSGGWIPSVKATLRSAAEESRLWESDPNRVDPTWQGRHGLYPAEKLTTNLKTKIFRANTLDPLIHRAGFQWLRGLGLLNAGFARESIVAFDCTMAEAGAFLVRSKLASQKLTRAECARVLGLSHSAQRTAQQTYQLRNEFGAHSGGWRWWDFEEMFDEVPAAAETMARQALKKLIDLEPKHRQLEPEPTKWSIWFWDNFEELWKAVWYSANVDFG